MKKKLLLIGVSSLVLAGAVTLSCVALANNGLFLNRIDGRDTDYTLTINGGDLTKETDMDLAAGLTQLVTDASKGEAVENEVGFSYQYAPYGEDGGTEYTYLIQSSGKIWNTKSSPIRSMKNIFVKGYGSVIVSWGWLDETDEIQYYNSERLNIGGDGDYSYFAGFIPNYVKISATDDSAPGISKIVITYDKSCTLADNPNFEQDGLRYCWYGDGLEVLGFSGAVIPNLVIPSSVNGRDVIRIADNAFSDNNGLLSVTIPNTVTWIDNMAFYSCDDLASVTFQSGGTEDLVFGNEPFGGVTSLTGTFTLPKRVALGQYALEDMKYISAFVMEDDYVGEFYCVDGVVYRSNYYGEYLFCYPMAKTDASFTVPNTVTAFNGYCAMEDNDYIQTLIFTNTGDLSLDEFPICRCDNLEHVYFNGSGAVTLCWYPFAGCTKISELILPANTICEKEAFGQLGDSVANTLNVFFEDDDISAWNVDGHDGGYWYDDKGAYVNVYLKSDAEIPAGDLPDGIAGSWHYVADVPTVW